MSAMRAQPTMARSLRARNAERALVGTTCRRPAVAAASRCRRQVGHHCPQGGRLGRPRRKVHSTVLVAGWLTRTFILLNHVTGASGCVNPFWLRNVPFLAPRRAEKPPVGQERPRNCSQGSSAAPWRLAHADRDVPRMDRRQKGGASNAWQAKAPTPRYRTPMSCHRSGQPARAPATASGPLLGAIVWCLFPAARDDSLQPTQHRDV